MSACLKIAPLWLFLAALALVSCDSVRILSDEERRWLNSNKGSITVASDPEYPPYDFLDQNGRPSGIAQDYISAMEERLNFKFKRVTYGSWDDIIEAAKNGEVDVLSAARETTERKEYLRFTRPYLEIPNVIIVRDEMEGSLSLDSARNLKVAVVEGYPLFEEIRLNHSLERVSVRDPRSGLEAVSFAKADFIVLNLATASHYIEKGGITNLRVTEHAGPMNRISLACPKGEPILASILEKGLAAVSQGEKRRIYGKWITLDTTEDNLSGKIIPVIAIALGAVLALLLIVIVWNITLRATVKKRTADLERELERLERKDFQLLQAQKMETVGTLAGGLAHDFNNVLVGILGSLSSMRYRLKRQGSLSKDEIEKYVDIIEHSGNRASEVVQRLLALSRKQTVSFEKVDLNLCLSQVDRFCQGTLDSSIHQSFSYNSAPALITGDGTLIEQVILNLCVNASQAMLDMRENEKERGGKLTVSIEKVAPDTHFRQTRPDAVNEEYWSISVADTGVGMPKEVVTKIFDPFFTTKNHGTGLGLAMAMNVVQRHGGYLDVFSEVGVGTTVILNLPVLAADEGEAAVERESFFPSGDEGLVLIVDDDDAVAKVAASMLEEGGYRVLRAADGEEGISMYKENRERIDLVLLDMVMPGKSGLEAFKEIRAVDQTARIVLTSGFRQDARVEETLSSGSVEFIQKPFTLEKLMKTVRQTMKDRSTDAA